MTDFNPFQIGMQWLARRDQLHDRAGMESIQSYLDELAGQLPDNCRKSRRVLHEAEDHLVEATGQLCADGFEPVDAAAAAIRRFGTPGEVIHQFEIEAPIEIGSPIMLRSLDRSITRVVLLGVRPSWPFIPVTGHVWPSSGTSDTPSTGTIDWLVLPTRSSAIRRCSS
jgi:hypothetical protein